ncbi:hypothetical protein [Draconibacterium sp.]|uniref:alpha-L-rhamnosidase-related protein n=1 Tax=Draconibacterium sp. TaxID=1965318 RepID=UPI0035664024
MTRLIAILFILFLFAGCQKKSDMLYKGNEFSVFTDKVVQGNYESKANSRTNLVSNYVSTASDNYSRLITFKFSINEKDNEMISGEDHWIMIGDENSSPLIKFGESDGKVAENNGSKLPVNYLYTFRLDMSEVLEAFDKQGYYEAFDGSRIAKSDFKGVYIAGGSEPLTWDFSNLEENNLELKDENHDGIYELTVLLNPTSSDEHQAKQWNLSRNVAAKPAYHSEQIIVDALYNLALEEALLNIEPDSTLRTGAKWGGVWTRDVSYSTLLAFAYHEPEVAKISLMKKVKRGRIVQDTGSGGAWPVSSDRTTWALAAWEIYKVTGEEEWLEYAFDVIKNTLDDDMKTLRSGTTGMYKGESSFLDWREQTYPKWMSNMDIYVSENLGTNVVHYQAHIILAEMARLLNKPSEEYLQRANEIKTGINKYLWMEDKGYYAQYLYGRNSLIQSPRFEALGEALAVLFDVADKNQAESILSNSPVTEFGTTCIYPQIPGIPPYHNNGIWPFVQSFWNIAAAKVGNEVALEHGLASIYRAAALFLSNYENFVAENGDYVGTEINSHRMLWSMAGNLAMVHRLFIGMHFDVDGIRFNPVIPESYKGTRTLSNFKYRKAVLDIEVDGFGNEIEFFMLDGHAIDNAFFPSELEGKHNVHIKMKNKSFSSFGINLVANKFSLPNPQIKFENSKITWNPVKEAKSYKIYRDGAFLKSTSTEYFIPEKKGFSEYSVTAVDDEGSESFGSEPSANYSSENELVFELENYISPSSANYTNFSGTGFIETSYTTNTEIEVPVTVETPGSYLIDLRYSNGTGPWNTDNNCAIRSLYVNNDYQGVQVFPQRGQDEWSDWGWSNSTRVKLLKGSNNIKLIFEEWNNNMDGKINTAMLDKIRLIKLDTE